MNKLQFEARAANLSKKVKDPPWIYAENMLVAFKDTNNGTSTLELHVLYHPVYCCPALYFRGWDDSGWVPLDMYKLKGWISGLTGVLQITVDEHPVLGVPFYHVHPCFSQDLLSLVDNENNILIFWMSYLQSNLGIILVEY